MNFYNFKTSYVTWIFINCSLFYEYRKLYLLIKPKVAVIGHWKLGNQVYCLTNFWWAGSRIKFYLAQCSNFDQVTDWKLN
jgi:hypothetical protein